MKWSGKQLKERARIPFRHNYWRCIIMCVILSFTSGLFTNPITVIRGIGQMSEGELLTQSTRGEEKTNTEILHELLDGIENKYVKGEDQIMKKYEGVIGFFINHIDSSNSIVYGIINALNQLIFKRKLGASVIIFIGVLVYILVWIFVKNMLRLGGQRFFLENHRYYSTDLKRIFFPFRVRKIWNQASIMLMKSVYQILWCFTVVGAFIKPYSYFLVPYIAAENPAVDRKTVFELSRRMMNGNKWRVFVMRLSFFPWDLANAVTFGMVDFFYLNAYRTSAFTELYFELRRQAILEKIPGFEVFHDKYLDPSGEDERIVVAGYIVNPYQEKAAKRVYYSPYAEEDGTRRIYESLSDDRVAVGLGADYRDELFPLPLREMSLGGIGTVQEYSLLSYLMFFFTFAIGGWIWEVSMHLFTVGTFANRGTMLGPWLPIYGVGGTLALLLFHRYVKKPVAVFLAAFVMSGVIEYTTATLLWHSMHLKWWDYTGNFMNLEGRICLEGLLFFAVGCMLVLYVVGPYLDVLYKRFGLRIRIAVVSVCLILFVCDLFYSCLHPNTGAGITSVFWKISYYI